jgi:hypothetical protein
MRELTCAELLPNTVDLSVLDFIRNNPNIVLLSCDKNKAQFKITTPIVNYAKSDAESYFIRKEENFITRNKHIAALFRDIFINEKYQMICTTTVTMPWNTSTSWASSGDTSTNSANPHLGGRYVCFEQTKSAISKYIAEGKFLIAINQLIACCASLSLLDSSVISYFFSNRLMTDARNHKIFKNMETGEMISAEDYKKIFETPVEKPKKKTKTTTTNDETVPGPTF